MKTRIKCREILVDCSTKVSEKLKEDPQTEYSVVLKHCEKTIFINYRLRRREILDKNYYTSSVNTQQKIYQKEGKPHKAIKAHTIIFVGRTRKENLHAKSEFKN